MRREPADVRRLKECFDPPATAIQCQDDPVDPPATLLSQDAFETLLSAGVLEEGSGARYYGFERKKHLPGTESSTPITL